MTPPVKPDLSDTQVARIADVMESRTPADRSHSRMVEDIGFGVGVIMALVYGSLEALRSVGWSLGKCEVTPGLPWVTIIMVTLCVAPKMLGRATAGKVWAGLAGLLPGNRNA